MALPTVHFDQVAAGTNSSLISAFMPRLQAVMFAAGWDIIWADSTAIGGGSSSVPAWDATPATNTSAGKAIYRMPANGHSRQWYVQIELAWGANTTNNHRFIVTIGTGESSGTLTGAGDSMTYEANASSTGLEYLVNASEDGFAFLIPASSATAIRWVLVERIRRLDGTVGDDLSVMGFATLTTAGFFPNSHTPQYGCIRYRASDGFQHAANRIARLEPITNLTASAGVLNAGTFTSDDGENGFAIGPINTSGTMSSLPRLLQMVLGNDSIVNTDHPVNIDGSVKPYRVPTTNLVGFGLAPWFLLAKA